MQEAFDLEARAGGDPITLLREAAEHRRDDLIAGGGSKNDADEVMGEQVRRLRAILGGPSAEAATLHLEPPTPTPAPRDPTPDMDVHAEQMAAEGVRPATVQAAAARDGDFIGEVIPALRPTRVTDASGHQIDVVPVVVELRDLITSRHPDYDPALQPRDRDRVASDAQIRDIVAKFDPLRLGQQPEADRGAPIVGPDRMVESGNGRTMALTEIYANHPDKAQAYRDFLAAQGVDVARYSQPVLVQQRVTPLSPGQRMDFTLNANKPIALALSPVEIANADARRLHLETLDLIRNSDDLASPSNADFQRLFLRDLGQAERAGLQDAKGQINSAGITRIRNAVLARAYGDNPLLARIAEATDDDAKSLTGALIKAAPEWAKLRAEVEAGLIPAHFDITANVLDAIQRSIDLRERRIKLNDALAQIDFDNPISETTAHVMGWLYNPTGTKGNGKDNIAGGFLKYAEEARKVVAEGFGFVEPVTPRELQDLALRKAHEKHHAKKDQGGLFDKPQALRNEPRPGAGAGGGDGGNGAAGRGQEPGQGGRGAAGAGLRRLEGGPAGAGPNAQLGPIAQPLRAAAEPMTTRKAGPTAGGTPPDQRQFPQRRELAGEAQKPIAVPPDLGPNEIRDFNITNEMLKVANALGRKLEIDGRFSIRGALGEYKPQMGVLRIRHAGDTEVFAHELGHAIDQRLSTQVTTGPRFAQIKRQFVGELKPLDANTVDPSKQTASEGLAEFLRMYVNNPAYARNQAPGFAREFEALLAHDPELGQALAAAQRMSQISTSLSPVDAMRTQIAPPAAKGALARARRLFQTEGIPASFSHLADTVYASVVASDHWVGKFAQGLKDARFDKTGAPLPLGWKDPSQMFRMLPGAKQAAVDALINGVRAHGGSILDAPVVAGLHEHLSLAFGGRLSRLYAEADPIVRDLNSYLMARRAAQLWDRYNAGQLRNPPIGRSEAETRAAIPQLEALYPQFRQAADGVFAFTKAYWDKKFDAGLIPREIYEAVNAQGSDYVPFQRDMTDTKVDGAGGASSRNGVADNGLRKFKGSSRAIVSPIHSIIEDVAQTERMIAHNETIKAFHKLAQSGGEFSGRFLEQVPNSEIKGTSVDVIEAIRSAARKEGADKTETEALIAAMEDLVGEDATASIYRATDTTPRGERILFYWDGGKRVALKVGQDDVSRQFFDVFSALSVPERDIAKAVIGKANAMFAAMVTNAPEFALKNLVMDNVSRIFIGRNAGWLGRVPGAAIAAGVHTALFDREFARAYAAFGGIRGGLVSQAARVLNEAKGVEHAFQPRTIAEMKAELLGDLSAPKDLVKSLVMSPLKAVEKIMKAIEYTETAGRLGQAKIVFNHLKKQGVAEDDALRGAFFESRDVLDYDRHGAGMATATKLIPFLNAGIQGTDRALRNLAGAPLQAIREAHARGGLDKLDAPTRAALNDAIANWGMIAAGVGVTMGYAFHMANDPRYQKETDYMRRRYFIFYPGGDDKDGNPMKVTIPKPFDLPGALMAASEFYVYGMIRQDPETYAKAAKNMLDGFIPRQFMGWEELAGSSPPIKVLYEHLTGKRLPFEGRNAMDIVPRDLAALPPEMQFDAYSSWLSKKIGTWFGVSPKKVEHVMDGLGATTSRDVNAVLTAAFDQNPRMTQADAMTKFFFGGLYRQDLGGGQARADVMNLMARDNGTYAQLAAGYRRAIEGGDDRTAETLFNRGNDTAKTLMVLSSDAAFKPEMRAVHPLVRTEKVGEVASAVLRDLAGAKVAVEDRSRKRGQVREKIDLEPSVARAIAATVTSWMAEEMRNGLAAVKEPGYATYPLIDTSARLEAIRALSPDVAEEIEGRLAQRRVLPIAKLAEEWPRVKDLILSDRTASARDLARTYKELSR